MCATSTILKRLPLFDTWQRAKLVDNVGVPAEGQVLASQVICRGIVVVIVDDSSTIKTDTH